MSVGSIFSGLALNGMLRVFSYLVPERHNTLLLGAGLGKSFSGNPKYFYLYLARELSEGPGAQFDFTWITKSDDVLNTLRQANRPVVDALTFAGFWAILRSEFLILESGHAICSGAHDIVYVRIFWDDSRSFRCDTESRLNGSIWLHYVIEKIPVCLNDSICESTSWS